MTQKVSKRSAAIDSHIQGWNLEDLISNILKFRDRLQGRQTNYIHSPAGVDNLCCRDWAKFRDPKNKVFKGLINES